MSVSYETQGHAALHLARAACQAPSPHNSQPWFFADDGHDQGFEVHADPGRRLVLIDPGGREMVMACGAALFNVRLAVGQLGFRPMVDVLPDSRDPAFLARVGFGAYAVPTHDESLMARFMPYRRTHRGPFEPWDVPEHLIGELCHHARAEGALLHIVDDPEQLTVLADLAREAEYGQRAEGGCVTELTRYAVGPGGVPAEACRRHPDRTLLPGRDYLGLARRSRASYRGHDAGTGTVAVLTTLHDGPADRLRAGQALQRVLLYAAAHGVSAAFHSQPLEVPEIRARLRSRLAPGRFPQAVLRLGRTPRSWATPRRAAVEVLRRTPVAAR